MLIDTSLRYIKMHFLVVPTDRSGAPVNLAFERAAFSNYRSNYQRSKLWRLARDYHYRAAITSFPAQLCKIFLFIYTEWITRRVYLKWRDYFARVAPSIRHEMAISSLHPICKTEPTLPTSKVPFSLCYLKLDWTILLWDYLIISHNINIFVKQRLVQYTSKKLVERLGYFS